jgi:hypothetical protein
VTFKLYNNPSGTGTPLFTDTETITLNGSTATATSKSFTTILTGTDYWVATFSGDSHNATATSGVSAEPVTITGRAGASATMGFWHNMNGQMVILSGGNLIGPALANMFPNLFGSGAAPFNSMGTEPVEFMNLSTASAAQVAAYFQKLFDVTGPHTYAQIMANVLAGYFDEINNTPKAKMFGFMGSLFNTQITITQAQATLLGFTTTHIKVIDYLNKVNAIMGMAAQPGIIPSAYFIVFNDISNQINVLNDI